LLVPFFGFLGSRAGHACVRALVSRPHGRPAHTTGLIACEPDAHSTGTGVSRSPNPWSTMATVHAPRNQEQTCNSSSCCCSRRKPPSLVCTRKTHTRATRTTARSAPSEQGATTTTTLPCLSDHRQSSTAHHRLLQISDNLVTHTYLLE
jgi:hypothetical protein